LVLLALYRDHDVDVDPLIVLACGHILSRDSLDGHMGFNNVYEMDPSGRSQQRAIYRSGRPKYVGKSE
jgi:hypothetical protein